MITLGIDLSSMPDGTFACRIDWLKTRALAKPPSLSCTDNELDKLISKASAIGIAAPFGWPEASVAAVTNWSDDEHQRLAWISETAHKEVAEYLRTHPPASALTAGHLGRLRREIKQHLEVEMKEIDALVEKIIA